MLTRVHVGGCAIMTPGEGTGIHRRRWEACHHRRVTKRGVGTPPPLPRSALQAPENQATAAQRQRTERTKAALLAAARTVLLEHGYAAATVAMIARAAGRAHGTFYLYYTNKEDIYSSLLNEMWEDLYQQSRAMWRREDPLGSVHDTVRRYVHAYGENVELWQLLTDMSAINPRFRVMRDERRRQFVRKIQRGLDGSAGLAKLGGMRTDILAEMLAAMVDEICSVRFMLGRTWDTDELVEHITIVWGRAVGYLPNASAPTVDGASSAG